LRRSMVLSKDPGDRPYLYSLLNLLGFDSNTPLR
jgi:hypothetical protein